RQDQRWDARTGGRAVRLGRSVQRFSEQATASSSCRQAGRGGAMKVVEDRVRGAASDLANFLACQELTQLDLRAARRVLRPPHPRDLGFEDLVRRGEEHERAGVKEFGGAGGEGAA